LAVLDALFLYEAELRMVGILFFKRRRVDVPVYRLAVMDSLDGFAGLADIDKVEPLFFEVLNVLAVLLVRAGNLVPGLLGYQRQRSDAGAADSREKDMHASIVTSRRLGAPGKSVRG